MAKVKSMTLRKIKESMYSMDNKLNPKKMQRYCPCCDIRFRSFTDAHFLKSSFYNSSRYVNTRQDVICPVCNSLPRHRILAFWFEKNIELLLSSTILYFAPEKSMMRWMKNYGISCTTADLILPADLKLDIQDTGLQDESYDLVVCNHVLEHVDDFRVALKEVYRILKISGTFICSFPMDPQVDLLDEDREVKTDEERTKRFGQWDHQRVFGMHADRFLRDVGFSVETINGKDYPPEILPVLGPADYDINLLFVCRKD